MSAPEPNGPTETQNPVGSSEIVVPTRPEGALVILTWKCKCHGWLYSHPNCCKHTDVSNLIPPGTWPGGHNIVLGDQTSDSNKPK